jgi:hypothetical protein
MSTNNLGMVAHTYDPNYMEDTGGLWFKINLGKNVRKNS